MSRDASGGRGKLGARRGGRGEREGVGYGPGLFDERALYLKLGYGLGLFDGRLWAGAHSKLKMGFEFFLKKMRARTKKILVAEKKDAMTLNLNHVFCKKTKQTRNYVMELCSYFQKLGAYRYVCILCNCTVSYECIRDFF